MKAVDTGREPVTLTAMEQFVEKELQIFQDDYAVKMLTPDMKFFISLCRFKCFRNWIISSSEKAMPGAYTDIVCRKRFIDDKLLEKINEISAVIEIGAGYDSRSLRICNKQDVLFCELDFQETMAEKQKMLEKIDPSLPERISLIGIDFNHQKIGNRIELKNKMIIHKPVFYIMEAVTMYLTKEGIRDVFEYLSKAPKGSYLAFTYIDQDFIEGKNMMQWDAVYNKYVKYKVWQFGLHPDKVADFLDQYGWELREDAASKDVVSKEILNKRGLKTTEVERFVFASKRHR